MMLQITPLSGDLTCVSTSSRSFFYWFFWRSHIYYSWSSINWMLSLTWSGDPGSAPPPPSSSTAGYASRSLRDHQDCWWRNWEWVGLQVLRGGVPKEITSRANTNNEEPFSSSFWMQDHQVAFVVVFSSRSVGVGLAVAVAVSWAMSTYDGRCMINKQITAALLPDNAWWLLLLHYFVNYVCVWWMLMYEILSKFCQCMMLMMDANVWADPVCRISVLVEELALLHEHILCAGSLYWLQTTDATLLVQGAR